MKAEDFIIKLLKKRREELTNIIIENKKNDELNIVPEAQNRLSEINHILTIIEYKLWEELEEHNKQIKKGEIPF